MCSWVRGNKVSLRLSVKPLLACLLLHCLIMLSVQGFLVFAGFLVRLGFKKASVSVVGTDEKEEPKHHHG